MAKDIPSAIQAEILKTQVAPINLYEIYAKQMIIVSSSNDRIDATDDGGAFTASLTTGTYNMDQYCAHVKEQLDSAGTDTFTVKYLARIDRFQLSSDGSTLEFNWNTGANTSRSAGRHMGFDISADDTGANEYTSDNFREPTFKYTDCPYDISYNNMTYTAISISRDNISGSLDQSFDQTKINITNVDKAMGQTLSTTELRGCRFAIRKVFPLVSLAAGAEIQSFVGIIESIAGDQNNVAFTVNSRISNLRREMPMGQFRPDCRWRDIRDSRCNALNAEPKDEAAGGNGNADGSTFVLASQSFPFTINQMFRNGRVMILDGDSAGEVRYITDHNSTNEECKVDRPFSNQITSGTKYRIWRKCRKIWEDCRDKFFSDQVVGGTADAGSDNNTLKDAAEITQADNYWIDAMLEITVGANSGQEPRRVISSANSTNTVELSPAFPNAISAGDTYNLYLGNTKRYGGFRGMRKQQQQTEFSYDPT